MVRRRQWQATPVLLPRKSHGWRSLVGCSPWGRYKLDATERLHFHFSCSQWRRQRQPTPVFLPGESQGRQSLVGCRLWGRTESDTTEATEQQQLLWLLSGKEYICQFRRRRFDPWVRRSPGEGNSNSLQYSCLENALDRKEPGRLQFMRLQRVRHN